MKKLTFLVLVIVALEYAEACVVDPGIQIANSPDAFIEAADIVFFGTLVQLTHKGSSHQIAVFEVEDVVKGPGISSVSVLNQFVSSCSRPFQGIGQAFYVFAVMDEAIGKYIIDIRGGFVPESIAKEFGFDPAPDS